MQNSIFRHMKMFFFFADEPTAGQTEPTLDRTAVKIIACSIVSVLYIRFKCTHRRFSLHGSVSDGNSAVNIVTL